MMEGVSLSAVFWLWLGLAVPAGLALATGGWIWLCLLTYVVLAWRVLVLHRPLPTDAGGLLRHTGRTQGRDRGPQERFIIRKSNERLCGGIRHLGHGSDRDTVRDPRGPARLRDLGLCPFLVHDKPAAAMASSCCIVGGRVDPVGLLQPCLQALCVSRTVPCSRPGDRSGGPTWRSAAHPARRNLPKCYDVAIDDGQTDVAVKFEIGEGLFTTHRYGNRLRLNVAQKLRCVKAAQVLPTAFEEAPVTART